MSDEKEWMCRVCHKLIVDGKCDCNATHPPITNCCPECARKDLEIARLNRLLSPPIDVTREHLRDDVLDARLWRPPLNARDVEVELLRAPDMAALQNSVEEFVRDAANSLEVRNPLGMLRGYIRRGQEAAYDKRGGVGENDTVLDVDALAAEQDRRRRNGGTPT